ncbi:MAG: glycosyltransferase family 4 protein [bacterium]|nr:glycosyltransferase family 4 protein [bacterium]
MRIAIVTPVMPPYGGGIGVIAYHHARVLSTAGYEVTVFTPDYGRSRLDHPDFRVVYLRPALTIGNAALLPTLAAMLDGFALVHLHYPFIGAARPVLRAFRRRHPRLVLHYHMDLLAPGLRGILLRGWQRAVLPSLVRAADRIVVLSLDYAQQGKLSSMISRDPQRFTVLPNGVEARRFTPGPKPQRLVVEYGLQGARIVLFVGSLDAAHYFKGVPVLLEAMTRLPQDVRLVVVGGGGFLERYRRMAERSGLAARVRFTGAIPTNDLPDHYRLADVVTLPSVTRSEAFGVALLEAMAVQKPVVATALPGVRTVVGNGAGLLAKPGDAADLAEKLTQLLDDPPRADACGKAGHEAVLTKYRWTVVGDQLLALYHSLLH